MNEHDDFDDEDLILYHYGELEPERAWALERALDASSELRERHRMLNRTLSKVGDRVPDPGPDLEQRVWARLEPQLESRDVRTDGPGWLHRFLDILSPRLVMPLATVSVLTLVAAVAFYAGRTVGPAPQDPGVLLTEMEVGASERVLTASVVDHLSGSERLMLELVNRRLAGDTSVDLESERRWAQVLLMANRLYRYAAEQADQPRIAHLLQEMEPVLVALANSDQAAASDELKELQASIANRDLLFKVRSTKEALGDTGASGGRDETDEASI